MVTTSARSLHTWLEQPPTKQREGAASSSTFADASVFEPVLVGNHARTVCHPAAAFYSSKVSVKVRLLVGCRVKLESAARNDLSADQK